MFHIVESRVKKERYAGTHHNVECVSTVCIESLTMEGIITERAEQVSDLF